MKLLEYKTKFVATPPKHSELEDGVLYVLPHCNCAIHKCMCGCKDVVVLAIDENNGKEPYFWGWTYTDGNVSITPSVGNFQFPCKSHYFLQHGKVKWC